MHMSDDTSNTGETKITDDEDAPVFTWFYDGVGIDDGTGDAVFALLKGIEALEEAFGLRGGSYALPPFRPYIVLGDGSRTPYIVARNMDEVMALLLAADVDAHTPRVFETSSEFRARTAATCPGQNPPLVFII